MALHSLPGGSDRKVDRIRFALRLELEERLPANLELIHRSWMEHPSFNWLNYREAYDWTLLATSCLCVLVEELPHDPPYDFTNITLGFYPDGYSWPSSEFDPVSLPVGRLGGVAFLMAILEQWAGRLDDDFVKKLGLHTDQATRHAKLLSRLKSLLEFLPSPPIGLLNEWESSHLDEIANQWAPAYAIYCTHCGNADTRLFSGRHFGTSCPQCQSSVRLEFRIPPTYMLEAQMDGCPPARPWFGDLTGLPRRADKLVVEQVLPLRLQVARLKRKRQYGRASRTLVGVFPNNSEQLDSLYDTMRPQGWSLEVRTVEGKIALTDQLFKRRYGIIWLPNEADIDSMLLGMALEQAASTLVKAGAQAVCSTMNAYWFLDSVPD